MTPPFRNGQPPTAAEQRTRQPLDLWTCAVCGSEHLCGHREVELIAWIINAPDLHQTAARIAQAIREKAA